MEKISGIQNGTALPEKVLKLYQAVKRLVVRGVDIADMKVSAITEEAGIGKGTAYDYFDSKEEIIVYAMLFFVEEAMSRMEQEIWQQDGFKERMAYALDRMDMQEEDSVCLLCFTNLLFASSQAGQLLRETLGKRKEEGRYQPLLVAARVIEKGISDGEIRADLPVSYMAYILLTKVVAYLAFVLHGRNIKAENGVQETDLIHGEKRISREAFRCYVLEGILEEFKVRQ